MNSPFKKIIDTVPIDVPQTTIATPITIGGYAGFINEKAEVTLLSSEPNTGIVFEIGGINRIIPATVEHLVTNPSWNCTCLKSNDDSIQVVMVEHLLAAIAGFGISNIKILTQTNGLIPMMDGSSFDFCNAILKAGIVEQEDAFKKVIQVKESVKVELDDCDILLEPSSGESLVVTAVINFDAPIGVQTLEYHHSTPSFCLTLAWARTFGYRPFTNRRMTLRKLPGFQIIEGSYVESNMIVYKKGKYKTHIRRSDEAVRHKVLDFLGDITLLGALLQGHVKLYKPGHRLNMLLLQKLWGDLKEHGATRE